MLDALLDDYVEKDRGTAELIAAGHDPVLIERGCEWSTWPSTSGGSTRRAPINQKNFGRDRRLPITNWWREPRPL